jgi:AmiR/NasT family two-component response regulator
VALNSRVIIEQAKGIIAERLQVTPDRAFILLRAYSRNNNYPLTRLVGDVISGTSDFIAGGQAKARPAERGEPAGR